MYEAFRVIGRYIIDGSDASSEIDRVTGQAEDSSSRMSNAFGIIGNASVAMGKAVVAGVTACAGAITLVTKQAVGSYANYEQLVGGVETLFGDSADKVMEYAHNAYATAGMSANKYMETVTSFSASLLQGLGGDTSKATEYAQMAIVDMADNANKMG